MWTRRVDLNICEPLANGFRFSEGLPLFQNRIVDVVSFGQKLYGLVGLDYTPTVVRTKAREAIT